MAKTIRGKDGWPGKKRTYHCGRKRCRYLKDMREERRLEHEVKAAGQAKSNPRIVATRSDYLARRHKANRSRFRDHQGRLHKS